MNKKMEITDLSYRQLVKNITFRYRESSLEAALSVNKCLITFYWNLGSEISERTKEKYYGDRFYATLSSDLRLQLPQVQGLSETNLRYVKRFFEFYRPLVEVRPELMDELGRVPWGHHRLILDRCRNEAEKAVFYLRQTIDNGWSRALLLNFLDTDLYSRQGKALTNFKRNLPVPTSDLAQSLTKDPYCFDFLSPQLRTDYNEKLLKDALLANITRFLTELGTGFAYIGREYRLQIGEKEKFLDLLFYNLNLQCYVVVEVKIDEFDSADLGQLGTYVSAVNHLLRKEGRDNPTIGLLVCKSKDNLLAQYALEASSQPLGISEYELSKIYPAKVEGTIPSVKEIEAQLNDISEGDAVESVKEK